MLLVEHENCLEYRFAVTVIPLNRVGFDNCRFSRQLEAS